MTGCEHVEKPLLALAPPLESPPLLTYLIASCYEGISVTIFYFLFLVSSSPPTSLYPRLDGFFPLLDLLLFLDWLFRIFRSWTRLPEFAQRLDGWDDYLGERVVIEIEVSHG